MNLNAWMRRPFLLFAFASATAVSMHSTWNAQAAEIEIPVALAESSYPSGYNGKLVAVVDQDERDGSIGPIQLFRYTDSRTQTLEYTVDELRKGMTLIRALGRNLLMMRSRDFDAKSGGSIDVVFYREFLGSDRRQLTLQYHPELNDEWVLRTDDQRGRDPFNLIHLQIGLQFGAPTTLKAIQLFSEEFGSPRMVRNYDSRELPRATPGKAPN